MLPPALTAAADYGMIVLSDDPAAARLALYVMSLDGRGILQRHGFDPAALDVGASRRY